MWVWKELGCKLIHLIVISLMPHRLVLSSFLLLPSSAWRLSSPSKATIFKDHFDLLLSDALIHTFKELIQMGQCALSYIKPMVSISNAIDQSCQYYIEWTILYLESYLVEASRSLIKTCHDFAQWWEKISLLSLYSYSSRAVEKYLSKLVKFLIWIWGKIVILSMCPFFEVIAKMQLMTSSVTP